MPAPDSQDERRDERLVTGLFWGGVGIAPLAALLLLIGQSGGPLRVAAVLAILAVVMIGLSITLRNNSDAVRVELEEILYEEIDALRKDVREDIGTAARATHKSFGEKLQVLYEQLNALRAQLDAIRAEADRSGRPTPEVRHTETVQVTTRQTIVDPREGGGRHVEGRRSRSYDRDGEQPRYERPARYEAPRYDGSRPQQPRHEQPRHEQPRHEQPRYDEPRYEEPRYEASRYEAPAYEEPRYGDDRWSREVRMGERRAAVHADDSGADLRYEDRWATMRSEGTRRDAWRGTRDVEEQQPPEPTWGRRAIAALPAGGQQQPLWDDEPDREPVGRRHRDDENDYRYRSDSDDRWRR